MKSKTILTLIIAAIFIGCNAEPDLNDAKKITLNNLTFEIPNNWYIAREGEQKEIGFKWLDVKSPSNFVFAAQHYNSKMEYSLNELASFFLKNVKEKMGEVYFETKIIGKRKPISIKIEGNEINGLEIEFTNEILGFEVEQRTQVFQIVNENYNCIFYATTNQNDWEREKKGLDLITSTLKIH